ncbi:MAG: DUF1425 domain-containing protein [Phycisphaerales bacterium]
MRHLSACIVLLAATAPAVLSGCESAPPPLQGGGAPMADPRISVLDGVGASLLRFQPAIMVDVEPAPIEVQVPVQNASLRDTYYADYRFVFFDAQGRQLEPIMGWTFLNFEPTQSQRMIGKALDRRAVNWKLEVKRSR